MIHKIFYRCLIFSAAFIWFIAAEARNVPHRCTVTDARSVALQLLKITGQEGKKIVKVNMDRVIQQNIETSNGENVIIYDVELAFDSKDDPSNYIMEIGLTDLYPDKCSMVSYRGYYADE